MKADVLLLLVIKGQKQFYMFLDIKDQDYSMIIYYIDVYFSLSGD